MTGRLFGTDGIRGKANREPMTAETALRVGMAAGRVFTRGEHHQRVVIGKDTRLSCYMIEYALTAGFASVGMEVLLLGPMPTPAVGMLTRSLRADLGVMISASHNVFSDNGIKLFGPDGYKLSDEVEDKIEHRVKNGLGEGLAPPAKIGRARRIDDAQARYIEFVKATFPKHLNLEGLRVVVDCANGAAYKVAPAVLWELGADVVPLGVSPDGLNINLDCGSTAPEALRERVRETRADLGIALDGDADRALLVDETGQMIDGDQVMALVAKSWAASGRLQGGGVVSTVMANLGLERFLGDLGLKLARTVVGDRYVVEHMRTHGFNVGGEPSGHIVLSDYSTTGDGLVAALQVLAMLAETGGRASKVCRLFEPVPQIMTNVRYRNGVSTEDAPVKAAIEKAQAKLGTQARLVIRKSGTEPVIRVMAEGDDARLLQTVVGDIVAAIEQAAR